MRSEHIIKIVLILSVMQVNNNEFSDTCDYLKLRTMLLFKSIYGRTKKFIFTFLVLAFTIYLYIVVHRCTVLYSIVYACMERN